ncbi:MAG: 16S rRNA (uracil(1498)-N(3))-methyltransferase [Treponema sp.]|jgi:16S rRNA (uracil1498-N3)-methyltransferase|nr:16S rRNA (uracil(1498)-N(3))-methyltransferase [Treponema sp.]
MKQFVLSKTPDNNGTLQLNGKDFHYLTRVRRLAVGEYFPALLPDGTETVVQITSIGKSVLTVKTENTFCEESSPGAKVCAGQLSARLILFQALPKGDKMDLIVRQAAETGIAEIVPFVSEFSVAKKNVGLAKFSRWERIIKEALQQSGSKTATVIKQPLTMNELLEYWKTLTACCNGVTGLLFHHRGLEQISLHGYLDSIEAASPVLVIGPEGGFSDTEVALFMENGFKPFTIGDTILRTETAALYCAAAVKIILLEKNSWQLK